MRWGELKEIVDRLSEQGLMGDVKLEMFFGPKVGWIEYDICVTQDDYSNSVIHLVPLSPTLKADSIQREEGFVSSDGPTSWCGLKGIVDLLPEQMLVEVVKLENFIGPKVGWVQYDVRITEDDYGNPIIHALSESATLKRNRRMIDSTPDAMQERFASRPDDNFPNHHQIECKTCCTFAYHDTREEVCIGSDGQYHRISCPHLQGGPLYRKRAHMDDTDAEKAINAFGGSAVPDPAAPGSPITDVNFQFANVTDAGLKEIAGLTSLQDLNLQQTQVTDMGLKELASHKSLQTLNLAGTKVTDTGLKELAGLTSLRTLSLNQTQVTDVGLNVLAVLKSLVQLGLGDTQVTDAGVVKFRQALPNCIVIRDDTVSILVD